MKIGIFVTLPLGKPGSVPQGKPLGECVGTEVGGKFVLCSCVVFCIFQIYVEIVINLVTKLPTRNWKSEAVRKKMKPRNWNLPAEAPEQRKCKLETGNDGS